MKRLIHCHPLLITAAPILFLHTRNPGHFATAEVASWLAIAWLATVALFFLALWLIERPAVAACVVSCGLAMFLLYGHVFSLLWYPALIVRQRYLHAVLLFVFTALFGSISYALIRTRRDVSQLAKCLTVGTSVFLLLSLIPWFRDSLTQRVASRAVAREAAPAAANDHPPSARELPDIYFIILDGYARADVLSQNYGFDNSSFLDELRNKGFYIAERSCTNYPLTHLSLSSSLSLRYHDEEQLRNPRETYFYPLIHRPLAAELLQSHGYRYVQLCTNWAGTQNSAIADVRLNADQNPLTGNFAFWLRQTTMARLWDGVHARLDFADANERTLASLPTVASMDAPTFTLAHVIAPHPPYVFDRQGRRRSDLDQDSRDSYVQQLEYVNTRVLAALEQILAHSSVQPIILIQSDHGSGYFAKDEEQYFQERMPILSAWLVPDAMRGQLYPTISPVNTFRLLLSECFQQNYPLLPERHFISYASHPSVVEVTHRIRDGLPIAVAAQSGKSLNR